MTTSLPCCTGSLSRTARARPERQPVPGTWQQLEGASKPGVCRRSPSQWNAGPGEALRAYPVSRLSHGRCGQERETQSRWVLLLGLTDKLKNQPVQMQPLLQQKAVPTTHAPPCSQTATRLLSCSSPCCLFEKALSSSQAAAAEKKQAAAEKKCKPPSASKGGAGPFFQVHVHVQGLRASRVQGLRACGSLPVRALEGLPPVQGLRHATRAAVSTGA